LASKKIGRMPIRSETRFVKRQEDIKSRNAPL